MVPSQLPEEIVSRVVACPKCARQYQMPGDPTGQKVQCASCKSVFTIGQPAAAGAVAVAAPQKMPATPQAKLFPDSLPGGPDPLANHVIADPGFAEVDIDEVRRQREARERKNKKYEADDPLAKFNREQREKKQEEAEQARKTRTGIKIGVIGGSIYILLLIIFGILAINNEWSFYALFGLWVVAALISFMVDIMLVQHVKELDPEQYPYYAFLPPYRIYYWIVHWKELMGWVVMEMIFGIPMLVNAFLVWHFDNKWAIGWFSD